MQWAQVLDKGPWLQMYTVSGNCTALGRQTTEGSPGWTWQAGRTAYFCYLGDMLSAAGSSRICYQFPLHTTSLSRHVAICTALVCRAQSSTSVKLGHWQIQWQGNNQTDLQCQTARHCHHQVQWATCPAWHWGSGSHSEGEKAPLVWTCGSSSGAVKIAFDIQVDGRCGPGRPKMTWKQLTERDCREWKTYLEIWCEICHACSKPAIWKGAHWCGCCPCTCMLIKNLIMIYDGGHLV